MTPAARLQAAIEIVDDIIIASQSGGAAADTLIKRYFKTRRYAGSKDRRAVRELVYRTVRRYGEAPANGRSALIGLAQDDETLRSYFDGSKFGPPAIGSGEIAAAASDIPERLRGRFASTLGDADIVSLMGRAPLDIRVNTMHISREDALNSLGEDAKTGKLSDRSIRLPTGYSLESHPLWQNGHVDIQDEGSQLIAGACPVEAGMTAIDLCAGAGGKTLALYDAMAGSGRIIACDTNRSRLSRLAPRAKRCRMPDIEERLLNPGQEHEMLSDLSGKADCVLVDAPCTGTGTWRRNPEARWRLTPDAIDTMNRTQAAILDTAASLVARGGNLIYAVCSLLKDEGEEQILRFLENHSGFRKVEPANPAGLHTDCGILLTPARHQTDGFFFARLERAC